MTERKTYWIADIDGVKACVVGADRRDYWVRLQGWTETTPPERLDRVWIRNVDHGGKGVMTYEASQLHEGLGWYLSDPPTPQGAPYPPEPAVEAPPQPAPDKPGTTTTPASGGIISKGVGLDG